MELAWPLGTVRAIPISEPRTTWTCPNFLRAEVLWMAKRRFWPATAVARGSVRQPLPAPQSRASGT